MRTSTAHSPSRLLLFIIFAVVLAQTVFPLSQSQRAGTVIVLTIGLWASGRLPEYYTALLFFLLCVIGQVVPLDILFSGFASPAVWLFFSGAVLGMAINHTGLGAYLARCIAPLLARSVYHALAGSMLLGSGLMFIMPSAMGRILLLLPIVAALAQSLGYQREDRAYRGMLLGMVFATFLPAFTVLPANVPNNILIGMMDSLFANSPSYLQYLVLHFPLLGLLKMLILWAILCIFYRDKAPLRQPLEAAPLSRSAKQLALLLTGVLGLWLSEDIHGISSAWVGMIGALYCLWPGSGLLGEQPIRRMNLEPLFYVAAIVGMGVVAFHSGLATQMVDALLHIAPLSPKEHATNFATIAGLSSLTGILATLASIPAILTPMGTTLSEASGLSVDAIAMIQVLGFSTVWLPYQAPPLMIAIQSGYVSHRDVTHLCLILAVISVVVLWPLDYLWWQLLGYL
ncbi:anion permease [Suttonella sp. R2A3]|uniref:SLC13 family permease n=1 Tax=Suttonella sp. R2A3 TaxID=2908648 RepID=UPI001F3CC4C0|nr:SLC13 family permease [Suttonella sp. R2A3]UJF23950.1 anion permease [Suttonella sp. R2A3]